MSCILLQVFPLQLSLWVITIMLTASSSPILCRCGSTITHMLPNSLWPSDLTTLHIWTGEYSHDPKLHVHHWRSFIHCSITCPSMYSCNCITTLPSQSGLSHMWWEDVVLHFLYGKMRLPSTVMAPDTPYSLFYGKQMSVDYFWPFSCLTYIHQQKDQHGTFESHTVQCILIGYSVDYNKWRFWDLDMHKEVISDSAVFCKSVFPFCKPGLL